MGYRAGVLSEAEDTPAAQVAHWTVIGRADHLPALRAFCRAGRGGDRRVRERLGPRAAVAGPPSAGAARLADRLGQPEPAAREDASWPGTASPTPPGGRSAPRPSSTPPSAALGLPLILKTAASGYDGKGQVRVDARPTDARRLGQPGPGAVRRRGVGRLRRRGLGRRGPRRTTAGPSATRSASTATSGTSWTPRSCPRRSARSSPRRRATWPWAWPRRWGPSASLTVEFFLTADGRLLVNEIAPRPHNSGHLTIEAAVTSQFEQQVRGPLRPAAGRDRPGRCPRRWSTCSATCGPRPAASRDWDAALRADPGVKLHLYGKRTPAPGRKMGHLTVLDPDPETALAPRLAFRRLVIGH